MKNIYTPEEFKKLYENAPINESGTIKNANLISDELRSFFNDVVIVKSRGYVKNERDAAALLIDILKHLYNF